MLHLNWSNMLLDHERIFNYKIGRFFDYLVGGLALGSFGLGFFVVLL